MIKPERLKRGDTVAIVSLSQGMLGEPWAIHKLYIAKERLEKDFGFKVKVMPNALKGMAYLKDHPEKRAEDLMAAFRDKSIKAIFNAIGGNDTIRLLPYIDFDLIRDNPKIFTGFSDTTINHFMMNKAGLVSYYGCSVMNNLSEYIKINDYTLNAINNILINPPKHFKIESSSICSYEKDKVWWSEENMNTPRKFYKETLGYDVLQGSGKITGELLGGCVETFAKMVGTKIWPSLSGWKNKILCIEMVEITDETLKNTLINLKYQGVLDVINGILVGKPAACKKDYKRYRNIITEFLKEENVSLPVMMNINFGHSEPITILPFGVKCEVDFDAKEITLLEPATK